jgi:hypothetical protein
MRVLCALVLGLVVCTSAAAQTSDAVMQHYRVYRAALEQGDVVGAERAAAQALAASEARDGDGGRTAVLALNLATARLSANDAAGALAPAQRALTLSQNGSTGVDAFFAELVLGRAELATSDQPERLARVLSNDAVSTLPSPDAFAGGVQLGAWALVHRQPDMARDAWAAAGMHASGSEFGEGYGLGVARTWEAASIIMSEIGYTGNRGRRFDRDRAMEAYTALGEALTALRPLAALEAPNLELTVAQRALAETMAWRSLMHSKMRSDGQSLPRLNSMAEGDADGMTELGGTDASPPRCLVSLRPRPLPEFPDEELEDSQIGAVVLRVRLDSSGSVIQHEVVARAGREGFADAVDRVASRWSVTRREDSESYCRMPESLLVPVNFMQGG